MKILKNVKEMKNFREKMSYYSVGFVPTMGALHSGHFSLVERSKYENDVTVVSIYLNETQFNDPNDFKNYPSTLNQDLKNLEVLKVDAVFLPDYSQIYPDQYRYQIHELKESLSLCGKDRPGHFTGVLTVVMKLFNLVKPSRAYFGEKDYQQLQLIKGMVDAFFLDIKIIACPTQRDEFGLALSSRNKKLGSQDLGKAQKFAQILRNSKNLEDVRVLLEEQSIDVDYLNENSGRRFAAVRIGSVRLIDNVEL